jgi:hypothetical protein
MNKKVKDYANFFWEIFKTGCVIAFAIFALRLTGWL